MSDRGRQSPAASEPAGWQAQKSAATRALILEAAVRCLAESGHAATTTHTIAETAGLSRGAMLHHFPSKHALFAATSEHVHANRLAPLRKAFGRGDRHDADRVRRVLEALIAHARQPLSVAARELVASRGTASSSGPEEAAYGREWRSLVRSALPPSVATDASLEVVRLALEAFVTAPPSSADAGRSGVLEELERLLSPPRLSPG